MSEDETTAIHTELLLLSPTTEYGIWMHVQVNEISSHNSGYSKKIVNHFSVHLTLLERDLAMTFLSVCPSVCQTHALRQNEIIICQYINTIQ